MLEATRRVLSEGRPHAGIELLFTPKEEVGLLGAAAFDARPAGRAAWATSTTRPRRSARSSSARRTRTRCRSASTGGRPIRACIPRRAAPRSRPRRRRSRTSGSAGSTRRRRRTSASSTAEPPGTSSRSGARSSAEARSQDEAKLADLVQEMLEAVTFAAELGECEVETEMKKSYRGYRFKQDDLARPARLGRPEPQRPRADVRALRWRRRRQRLQRARPPVRQPRQRDGEHPHARRADLGRRPRGDDRRHPRARRRRAGCRLGCGAARSPRSSNGCEGLARIEVDGAPCIAYPRADRAGRARRRGAGQRRGARAGARVGRLRRRCTRT